MTDIVERLRSLNADFLHEEAADEIERLRVERDALMSKAFRVSAAYDALKAERDRLREALQRIAGTVMSMCFDYRDLAQRQHEIARTALGEDRA